VSRLFQQQLMRVNCAFTVGYHLGVILYQVFFISIPRGWTGALLGRSGINLFPRPRQRSRDSQTDIHQACEIALAIDEIK